MRHLIAALLFGLMQGPVLAVPPDDEEAPPRPTPTSIECPDGTAWDAENERCTDLKAGIFQDDERFSAARELAYAGRLQAAGLALDAMRHQETARVLTYRGFLARKSGDWRASDRYYREALEIDPGSLSTRSYLGMGLAARGDKAGAVRQLRLIRAHGGRGSWPERALLMALRSGGQGPY